MEKWSGVTLKALVIDPIKKLVEDGASPDELIEEVQDYRERGILPDGAVNWVLNQIG
jgi:hypothetical protein